MVNVENCQFLKGNCKFFSVIWMKWKQSVCSISLPCLILVLFTAFFYHFLFWRYLNSSSYIWWQIFCQTFCFHFQIWMIWTAMQYAPERSHYGLCPKWKTIFFGRNNKSASRSPAFRNFLFYQNIICFGWVMNLSLSWVMFSVKKVSFPAKTTVDLLPVTISYKDSPTRLLISFSQCNAYCH